MFKVLLMIDMPVISREADFLDDMPWDLALDILVAMVMILQELYFPCFDSSGDDIFPWAFAPFPIDKGLIYLLIF